MDADRCPFSFGKLEVYDPVGRGVQPPTFRSIISLAIDLLVDSIFEGVFSRGSDTVVRSVSS